MSYLAPASFHFVRGIMRLNKGSDIANLASLEVLALRNVASKIYYHKTCLSKFVIKIFHNLPYIILVMCICKIWKLKANILLRSFSGMEYNIRERKTKRHRR